jgi:hypothetical protein
MHRRAGFSPREALASLSPQRWIRCPRSARASYIDLRAVNDLVRSLTARGASADAM